MDSHLSPAKRKRETSPPPHPSQPASIGLLTPPPSQKKLLVRFSDDASSGISPGAPPQALAHIPTASSPSSLIVPQLPLRPEQRTEVTTERVEDGSIDADSALVKIEELSTRVEDIPTRPGDGGNQTAHTPRESGVAPEGAHQEPLECEDITPSCDTGRIKQEDNQTHETTFPSQPASATNEPYRLDEGPYEGRTVDMIHPGYLNELHELRWIEKKPGLKKAIKEWASKWTFKDDWPEHFPWGGLRLDEVPMYQINRQFLHNGIDELYDYGLFMALTYHVRKPEPPGSRYVFEFGKHCDQTIRQAYENSYSSGRSYLVWLIDEGIPEKEGYEDLADGLEFFYKEELARFKRRCPHAASYRMPTHLYPFGPDERYPKSKPDTYPLWRFRDKRIHKVPEYLVAWLKGHLLYFENDFPGLGKAIEGFELWQNTCRWNWRRKRGLMKSNEPTSRDSLRRRWVSTHPRLGNLLYPSTDIAVPGPGSRVDCPYRTCRGDWRCEASRVLLHCRDVRTQHLSR